MMEIKMYIGDINLKRGLMTWNSHDFETINDVKSCYGLTYMFHDTGYYHEDVVELLAELENRITITGVWDTDYEYDINE